MAKQRPARSSALTPERLRRLYRLLRVLADKPLRRDALAARLKVGLRKFYRDLQALRALGIDVQLQNERYALGEPLDKLLDRLPFPDPGLSFGEAMHLSK